MFKRSRRKIVISIMSILVLLWGFTLGVIYASSYFEMTRENTMMLKAYAQRYTLPGRPSAMPVPGGSIFEPEFTQSPVFRLSTFYTVAFSYQGEILEIQNDSSAVHSDQELSDLAREILGGKRELGTKKNLAFYKMDKGYYTLVTFKDNTVFHESAGTLFRYTLLFGVAFLIVFFFLSVWLAKKIVNPLEESYEKQKQFVSDAGHELKTPISVMSANLELLSRELGENKWLYNIQYENRRMGVLVAQLLELARTENAAVQMERVDLSRLVCGEALPFESVAFEKGFVLNTQIAENVCVVGNGPQLRQIVSILLDNAIRHSKEPGDIWLCLRAEHGLAKLSVINRADEIPEEQRTKLFERFYRADPVRNSEEKHYGLGLAIAKAIAIAHKGQIRVDCFRGFVSFTLQIPSL